MLEILSTILDLLKHLCEGNLYMETATAAELRSGTAVMFVKFHAHETPPPTPISH